MSTGNGVVNFFALANILAVVLDIVGAGAADPFPGIELLIVEHKITSTVILHLIGFNVNTPDRIYSIVSMR